MKSVVIGTAGHIDHGKSALVKALTGVDPDRLKEEKARGITIELGFASYEADDITFALVDVPGHERFVKTMLAGASGIDVVLLVVAADESVMPQTREHFDIASLLGVSHGVVALTKCDLVDEDTVELVRLETRELVEGSFLESAPLIPVSSKTGEGLDALRAAISAAAGRVTGRSSDGAIRLPVDRVFSMKGFGTVVTGTLASGRLDVDQELRLLPRDRPVKIRGLQVHGAGCASATAGQRVAVNLGGVDLSDAARGETLASPRCFEPTRRFDADLALLPTARALKHGARVRFHQGTSEILGRVAISSVLAREADAGVPSEVPAGARAHVRIRLESPAVLTRGDRYILRAYSPSITIGGGRVLDPKPPRGGTRTEATRTRFARLDSGPMLEPDDAIRLMVEEHDSAGLPLAALTWRVAVAPAQVEAVVARLVADGRVRRIEGWLVASEVIARLEATLLAALERYHSRQPLSEGLAREEARERMFGRASTAVFDTVVAGLVAAKKIVARDHLALCSHRLSLTDGEARAKEAIERAVLQHGLTPPDRAALQAVAGCPADVVERVLKLSIRQKVLVRVDALIFHVDVLERIKSEIRAMGSSASLDVGAFKARYGVTRKYTIPLLEYLDRERVTRRAGDQRVVV